MSNNEKNRDSSSSSSNDAGEKMLTEERLEELLYRHLNDFDGAECDCNLCQDLREIKGHIAALSATIKRLETERDDLKDDYLRRHKDACDRFEEIVALKHDIARLLTLTSEQATEIVGKDKEIAELRDRPSIATAYESGRADQCAEDNIAWSEKLDAIRSSQSVLLKKAETALDGIGTELKLAAEYFHERSHGAAEIKVDMARDLARAVLSELQLKGK